MDASNTSATEAITDAASKPCTASTRTRRGRGDAASMPVSSDIRENALVTEAEARLIMAALGDTIAQILNPGALE